MVLKNVGHTGHQQKKKRNKTVKAKGRNLEWEMDRFVKGKRKAIDDVAQTKADAGHSKAKCRKYYSCHVTPQQLYCTQDKTTIPNHLTLCQ